MVIASDLLLRGTAWRKVIAACTKFFTQRANYDVCLLATAIGVMYDQRLESLPDDDSEGSPPSVPRNVFNNNSEPFDELFQAAILTSTTCSYTDKERLNLAFGEGDKDFDKKGFLLSFANFGVNKLAEMIADDAFETAENIKDFLTLSVEGNNVDLDMPDLQDLTDEELEMYS